MAEALYGKRGYYTSPRPILGSRGDFTTTPKLNHTVAQHIARWISEAWQRQGHKLPIIELGPGDGTLAHDIRHSFNFLVRRKIDYHFVEISPHLAQRQQEKNQNKGTWHPTLAEALTQTNGQALIISNEFFDAFPVRIFNQDLEELHLDSQLQEIWQPAIDHPDSLLFKNPPTRFEIPQSIHHWMQSDLSQLKKGEILTIDYGGNATENYHRRPLGTLRAYAHHMRLHPPEAYQNPGHQDLTFDIHFDDLIHWSKPLGLKTINLTTQAKFLNLPEKEDYHQHFKVLHQTTSI